MPRLLLTLVLISAMLPVHALAVSLGDELILSRLGDPVEVEIEVLQWEDMDMDRVQISAANEQQYVAFQMTWLPVLDNLSFNLLGPNLDGEVRLLVSSREPLNEPFLELLLVLRWPGGSLLREYVLLFDPPGTPIPPPNVSQAPAPAAPTVMTEPVVVPEPEVIPEPQVAAELTAEEQPDVRTQVAIEVETARVPASLPASPSQINSRRSYQVRLGDSLWNIGRQFRPAGEEGNLFQVLVSLHDLNRGAFINGNISLLKANASLQIPDATDIARIDAARAELTFNERWNQGTQRFDAALGSEALPLFGGVEAQAEPLPEEAFEPMRPVGQELPPAGIASDDLIMVANVPTPLQTETGTDEFGAAESDVPMPQGSAVQSAEEIPQWEEAVEIAETVAMVGAVPGSIGPAVSVGLPSVIAPSAESLQHMMQAREQQRIALEQQVETMRIRMQEAQTVAALFSSSLQQAQESRAAREREYRRNSIVLGTLVLALVAGLVFAVVLVFRQASQLRRPRVATGSAIAAIAAQSPGSVPVSAVPRKAIHHERIEPGFHASQQLAEDAVADKAPATPAEHRTARVAAVRHNSPEDTYLIEELESPLAGTPPRKP